MTDKIKLTDRRVSLSNRYIETLKKKNKRYSVGDSEVIGLRIFVFEGGQKTFYYSYTTKEKEKGLEKLGLFGSVNVKEARNAARKIAKDVMDGRSPIEIRISRSGELTVSELVKTFIDKALKAPRYKPSTQKKWKTNADSWIFCVSNDPILRAMYAKSKLKIANKRLSECTKDFMKDWHQWIGTKTESQANALVEMLSVIFNWSIDHKLQKNNPAQFKKDELYEKKEDNRILTKDQKKAVLNYVLKYDERKEARLNMNYYKENRLSVVSCCLIAYSLLTGRRYRSEGGAVKWSMLSFPEKKLYLNDSKVGQMEYKMGPKVLKLLQAIKAEKFEPSSPFQYNDERNNYVFPSKWFSQINNQGKRNTRPWLYSVKGMWATILKNLGITYIPMYNCRHTYLTHALSKTKNILLVGKLAGHTQVKTTQRYAKILGEDVSDALNQIDSEAIESPKVVQFKK
tara:strand:- start:16 stop:1383 length:1368 start_codon:yes stop_codon:yes gene_type:complete